MVSADYKSYSIYRERKREREKKVIKCKRNVEKKEMGKENNTY